MEENLKQSLYLQVIHEMVELFCKKSEDRATADILRSFQNEKFDEVVEWIDEVEKFTADVKTEMSDKTNGKNSFWCNNMISRIRMLRAKRGPKFTFRRVSNVNMFTMTPLCLCEELYSEMKLLMNIKCAEDLTIRFHLNNHQESKFYEDQPWNFHISTFLEVTGMLFLRENTSDDWYRNKIAETRIHIAQYAPAFFLQSPQDVALLSLHEELHCEVRSLISVKMADLMTLHGILEEYHDLYQFNKVLRYRIRKVNKFSAEINQQLNERNSDKNSNWYRKKIEETKTLIHVLSQDLGSTISMFTLESKPPLDDVGYTKFWTLQLPQQLKKGLPISMMERNFKPWLFLQVFREVIELDLKHKEDSYMGSYLPPNEKFHVVEWMKEVDEFMPKAEQKLSDKSLETNSFRCSSLISSIRMLRAKRGGPNFIFPRVRLTQDVASSSISLSEELYCEIISVINIVCALMIALDVPNDHQQDKFNEDDLQERKDEVDDFLGEIKLQLEEKNPETDSGWYNKKIAEARTLIAKYEPAFSLQSQSQQDAGSSSMNMPTVAQALLSLHEELRYEIRSLIRMKCVDMMIAHRVPNDDHDRYDKFRKEIQERINEVNKFLTEINLQLQEKVLQKNSDWYNNNIAESRTLIAKRYSAFPFHSKDEGYTKIWSLQHLELQKGTSKSMMEQNFKPSLVLQVRREAEELNSTMLLESYVVEMKFWLYPNKKIDEVVEWTKEVVEFMEDNRPQLLDESFETNSFWCNNMLSRIRKLRAKCGPNFTSGTVNSSQDVKSISSRQKLHCELVSLRHIRFVLYRASRISEDYKFIEYLRELEDEVIEFFETLDEHFDWHRKIAEARMLTAKYEPSLSLLSQDVRSFSTMEETLLSLHEELCYEIRLLNKMKCDDVIIAHGKPNDDHVDLKDHFKIELQKWMNEANEFLTEIKLQLEENIDLQKNSEWCRNKIAESRTLIAKCYSSFPLRPQDVGYTKEQYQIFLSFRGEDTRYGFTRHLYNALYQEGFNVFMDDQGLERGDSISQILMEAIERSKLSIIIFSKNFANSTWCLDEVVKILECKQQKNQLIWPVCYKVEPSEVRHQNKNYGEAMAKHETRYENDVVRNWRSALHEVCGFNAFPYKKNSGYESDFIESIVKAATKVRDGS